MKSSNRSTFHLLLGLSILVFSSGCCRLNTVETDALLVTAPLSDRANVVLANLLEECPIVNGAWTNVRECSAIQSTAFGYYVGTRRNRDDLVRIGNVSAANESKKVRQAAMQMAMGNTSIDYQVLRGFPALFISSLFEHDGIDYFLFSKCLDTMTTGNQIDGNVTVNTFIAYFSALRYSAEVLPQERYLHTARIYADSVIQSRYTAFAAFAYGAIAKASRDPNDRAVAKGLVETILPQFFDMQNRTVRIAPHADYLSWIEAMISALADMAQFDPQGPWRHYAIQLLDYIFSDRYFNGKFLVHHINEDGTQADRFCAGCNFAALTLADRLYGDTLVFNPVKPPKAIECKLTILEAGYGNGTNWRDASREVRKRVKNNRLSIYVCNDIVGDPAEGIQKRLWIKYLLDDTENQISGTEGQWLSIP